MIDIPEPNIESNPEETFRKSVIKVLKEMLNHKKDNGSLVEYLILQDFGLDIAVFMEWPNNYFTVQFFELKAYTGSRPSGVGFGNSKGRGTQVKILQLENAQLYLANKFIRWLLVDGTKPKGSERFVIFDNIQAKNAIMGKLKEGKQNNFRIKDLMKNAVTWEKFINELNNLLDNKTTELKP